MNSVSVDILCEGVRDYNFILRFLKSYGLTLRDVANPPKDKIGSGEQYVRTELPKRMVAQRSRNHIKSSCLIVMTDADTKTVNERLQLLMKECEQKEVEFVKEDERVIVAIPKRNIETWVKNVNDNSIVDETVDYSDNTSDEECKIAAKQLAENCKKRSQITLPSLLTTCTEFEKIRNMVSGEK